VTATIKAMAGTNRRTRRAQNRPNAIRPWDSPSRNKLREIKNPEITKNTSTPMNPPPNSGRPA